MLKNSMFFDTVILKIILESSLSETVKNLTIDILKENADKMYGHFNVGEVYESLKILSALESDLEQLNITDDKILKALIYNVIRHHCHKNDELNSLLIKTFLENEDFRKKIIEIKNPQSGIVEFLNKVGDLVNELFFLVEERKSYLVLKKYQEIINYCRNCGIDPKLLNGDKKEELTEILSKKFHTLSIYRNPSCFRSELKKLEFLKEENYSPENFNYVKTFSSAEYFFQKLLHEKMVEYYRENQCIIVSYNKDINIYYLRNLVIVTYRFDDIPNMNLQRGDLNLNWSDRDFWAKVFDPKIDFTVHSSVNYYNEDNLEYFKVVPKEFDNIFFKSLGDTVLFTPEAYLDEAIIKYLKGENNDALNEKLITRMQKQAIPLESPTSKLMTGDYSFFFKDPTLVDELEVENITEHKYLCLIKSKTNITSRKKCIAGIITATKKQPKQPDIKKDKNLKSYNYEKRFKSGSYNQRLPYKDD